MDHRIRLAVLLGPLLLASGLLGGAGQNEDYLISAVTGAAVQPPPDPKAEAFRKAIADAARDGVRAEVNEAIKRAEAKPAEFSWTTFLTTVGTVLGGVIAAIWTAIQWLLTRIDKREERQQAHERELQREWREHEAKAQEEWREHEEKILQEQREHERAMVARFEGVASRLESAGANFTSKVEDMQSAARKEDKARDAAQYAMHRENGERLIGLINGFGALRDTILGAGGKQP